MGALEVPQDRHETVGLHSGTCSRHHGGVGNTGGIGGVGNTGGHGGTGSSEGHSRAASEAAAPAPTSASTAICLPPQKISTNRESTELTYLLSRAESPEKIHLEIYISNLFSQ